MCKWFVTIIPLSFDHLIFYYIFRGYVFFVEAPHLIKNCFWVVFGYQLFLRLTWLCLVQKLILLLLSNAQWHCYLFSWRPGTAQAGSWPRQRGLYLQCEKSTDPNRWVPGPESNMRTLPFWNKEKILSQRRMDKLCQLGSGRFEVTGPADCGHKCLGTSHRVCCGFL